MNNPQKEHGSARAMILCAGLGTRLRPVTEKVPKPLVPLFDRPVVEYTLDHLAAAGIYSAVINLHHLPGTIRKTLGDTCRGVNIQYSHEESEILGPVGGVRKALPLLGDGPVLVWNGDILLDLDPLELLETHRRSGAALTMTLGTVPGRPELHVVGAEKSSGRVVRVRKTAAPGGEEDMQAVNLGACVYEAEIIEKYVPPDRFYNFADELIPLLFANGELVSAHFTDGYWSDIGTIESYLAAHFDALDGRGYPACACVIEENGCGSGSSPPCFISRGARVDPSAATGPYAVIGNGSRVDAGAELSRCVVLPGAEIAAGRKVHNEVVY